MPFFPQSYLSPEPTLIQILSALDDSTPTQKSCGPRRQTHRAQQHPQQITPRFDVAETETAYELYGEVPGLQQDDLVIEFSDAQTIVIKGKTQRPSLVTNENVKGREIEQEATQDTSDTASSHHATVEDDEEYDQADVPVATPATTATAVAEEEQNQKAEPQQQEQQQQNKAKYWVAERRVGEFARSFSFAQRVDQDEVVADLRNGVIHVRVPKNLRKGRVVVNVN